MWDDLSQLLCRKRSKDGVLLAVDNKCGQRHELKGIGMIYLATKHRLPGRRGHQEGCAMKIGLVSILDWM